VFCWVLFRRSQKNDKNNGESRAKNSMKTLARRVVLAAVIAGGAAWWLAKSRRKQDVHTPTRCPLLSVQPLTAETSVFRFGIPSGARFGLSPLGHVMALDDAMTYRPYTPVDARSSDSFDILVCCFLFLLLNDYI